jgi:hypothetical protein
LTRAGHDNLISFTAEAQANNHTLMMHDIVHHITERHDKVIDANSIRHMLDRDPHVMFCRCVPMEEECLQVTAEDISANQARPTEPIEGVPAFFVSNMDEMDCQEWADRQQ